jgi:hypothetical protein
MEYNIYSNLYLLQNDLNIMMWIQTSLKTLLLLQHDW